MISIGVPWAKRLAEVSPWMVMFCCNPWRCWCFWKLPVLSHMNCCLGTKVNIQFNSNLISKYPIHPTSKRESSDKWQSSSIQTIWEMWQQWMCSPPNCSPQCFYTRKRKQKNYVVFLDLLRFVKYLTNINHLRANPASMIVMMSPVLCRGRVLVRLHSFYVELLGLPLLHIEGKWHMEEEGVGPEIMQLCPS